MLVWAKTLLCSGFSVAAYKKNLNEPFDQPNTQEFLLLSLKFKNVARPPEPTGQF